MFFKTKKIVNNSRKANETAFCAFVKGVWQALAEQNELDLHDWTQLQNVSNLCVLAWDCALGNYSEKEAKLTVTGKLQEFFHCNDENVAEFVRQTIDFKYRNYSEFGLLVLKGNVSLISGTPEIEVIFDNNDDDETLPKK